MSVYQYLLKSGLEIQKETSNNKELLLRNTNSSAFWAD